MKLFKILTADKSESFLNEEVGESYHAHAGAVEEALRKYAVPCKIRQLAKAGTVRILDFCFGLGYNSALAISEALEENPLCTIEVVGLEKDTVILQKIQEVNPPIPYYKNYKRLTENNLEFREGTVSVRVLLGDARETVKQLPENYFDAVFYDPFSPQSMPELWSEDLFKEMYRVMKPTGILATFSCARLVHENMSKAGLFWDNGPIFGRRGPGTIATRWE